MRYDRLVADAFADADYAVNEQTRAYLKPGAMWEMALNLSRSHCAALSKEDILQILSETWPDWLRMKLPKAYSASWDFEQLLRDLILVRLSTLVHKRMQNGAKQTD